MANTNTEVNLPQMQDAIASAIASAFPDFVVVEFDRDEEDESLQTPACLLQFDEAEPAPEMDAGTGQWPAMARFSARVVLNARRSGRADVKVMATALAAWMNLRRFPGVFADPCRVIACGPDEFSANIEKFRVWAVEWSVPAMFGNSAFDNGGDTPASFFSFAPWIGIPHVDDYVEIDGSSVTPP